MLFFKKGCGGVQNKMAPGITDNVGVPDSAQELLFNKCLVGIYSVPDIGQGTWNGEQINSFALMDLLLTPEKQKKKQLHLRA